MQFMGYRRADGKVGVRNHVAVVATVYCSSTVAQKIADATGAVAVTHEGGCLELGSSLEHTERVLRGVVQHPNIGGVLVIGLGCEQIDAKALAEAAGDKPAEYLQIQDAGGTSATIEQGIVMAEKILQEVAGVERQPCSLSELTLATQCGSSDTGSGLASNPALGVVADRLVDNGGTVLLGETGSLYGAAGVMAKRAVSPEVGQEIIAITDVIEAYYTRMGRSFRETNPTPGNIAGGLTTLVEKSLGGVRKGGTKPIQGVLKPGEQVTGKGLWIMDTSMGLGTHTTTDMLAGGAQIMVYTTGRGNPVGSAIGPVIKVTATERTLRVLAENMDFDASSVLRGEESIEECGGRMLDLVVEVANGELTSAERLDNTLFAIGKIAV